MSDVRRRVQRLAQKTGLDRVRGQVFLLTTCSDHVNGLIERQLSSEQRKRYRPGIDLIIQVITSKFSGPPPDPELVVDDKHFTPEGQAS